jgi:hypothetical protein
MIKILMTATEVRNARTGINFPIHVPLGAAALQLGSARFDDAKEEEWGQWAY